MITSTVFAEGGSNEGGNRENPFREIVLSRLNASVTPECLLFQNSILKLREKMTFQNFAKTWEEIRCEMVWK